MSSVERILNLVGRKMTLEIPESTAPQPIFKAAIIPLRYKNKLYMGGVYTNIGYNKEGYYLYIGPKTPNLAAFPPGTLLRLNENEAYSLVRIEKNFFGESLHHIWAIVRSVVHVF
jgi:hypothetical protein